MSQSVTPIVLENKDIYSVAFVEKGLKYKKGQRNKDGKTFTRYSRNGIAFSIPDEHPFNADFASGKVESITLIPGTADIERVDSEGNKSTVTVDTLNFASYINTEQMSAVQNRMLQNAKVNSMIKRYEHLATAPVTADLLNELENA